MTAGSRTCEDLSCVAKTVFDQVRRVLPPDATCEITLDSPLNELGLDSLARMDVLNSVEEAFGLRFSEDALYDMETCRDVIAYIEASTGHGSAHEQPATPVVAACCCSPPR